MFFFKEGKFSNKSKDSASFEGKVFRGAVDFVSKVLRGTIEKEGPLFLTLIWVIQGALAIEISHGKCVILQTKDLRIGEPENMTSVGGYTSEEGGSLPFEACSLQLIL
jgi:hypothetical protein